MNLISANFTKINEEFLCIACNFMVPKASSTCRDHCPKCLVGLHLDNNPGDRLAHCFGILQPIAWSQHKKKAYIIHYQCQKCGQKKVNKFLQHDKICADDFEILLQLSSIT